MLIYLLLLLLLLLACIAYILSKKDILSPPNIFSGGFIISILFAIPNLGKWNFDMGERTFWVIFLGILAFNIGFFLIYYTNINIKNKNILTTNNCNLITIKTSRMICFLIIELITIYLIYSELNRIGAIFGAGDTLTDKIVTYRINTTFRGEEEAAMASYVGSLYSFCSMSTNILIYIVINNYFINKSINKLYCISILLTVLASFLFGNRGIFVSFLLYTIMMVYIFKLRSCKWIYKIKYKFICKLVLGSIIFLMAFPTIGLIAVGRASDEIDLFSGEIVSTIVEGLGVYIGAPLKLLDLFLYDNFEDTLNLPVGYATFIQFYKWLSKNLDIPSWNITQFGLEFREDNLSYLGNVYTTFRPFFTDFGYVGVIVLSLILGLILGLLYYYLKHSYKMFSVKNIDYILILYSLVTSKLLLSFFSDKIYEFIFTIGFIKMLILFKIFEYIFVDKTKLKEK